MRTATQEAPSEAPAGPGDGVRWIHIVDNFNPTYGLCGEPLKGPTTMTIPPGTRLCPDCARKDPWRGL